MTTMKRLWHRDLQDGEERHIFEEQKFEGGAGFYLVVKGNGTKDEETVVPSPFGIGIHMPKGTEAEVHLIYGGSDTNFKIALIDIPRDKMHEWKEGSNGQQKWDDPDVRLEFNEKRIHLTGKAVALSAGNVEVKDGKVYLRGDVYSEKPIQIGTPPFEE